MLAVGLESCTRLRRSCPCSWVSAFLLQVTVSAVLIWLPTRRSAGRNQQQHIMPHQMLKVWQYHGNVLSMVLPRLARIAQQVQLSKVVQS